MPRIVDLPGRKDSFEITTYATSVTNAIKLVREKPFYAAAAGDDGAINVYRDDAGRLRGQFMRRLCTLDDQIFATVKEMRDWLTQKWPLMHR